MTHETLPVDSQAHEGRSTWRPGPRFPDAGTPHAWPPRPAGHLLGTVTLLTLFFFK